MPTLRARIQRAAEGRGGVTFVDGASSLRVPWARLCDEACALAAALQSRGVGPGTQVALLGPTSRALVTAIEATWLAGGAVVVLPLPMRLGSIEEFVAQTQARIRSARAALVVADPTLLDLAPLPGDGTPVVRLPDLAGRPEAYEEPRDGPEDLAVIQFTSGSTADPKGVMLPHRCVTANLDAIFDATRLDIDDDVVVSWLPLYHDMGLIGTLGVPMTTGTELVLAAPQEFLASPSSWMEWMSAFSGTATAGPSFAYALAARALGRLSGLDLSRWRLALNGAEAVDPAAVEAFCSAGALHDLDRRAALCVYGLAEATLAVTFPERGGLSVDTVDRVGLETDGYATPTGADEPKGRRLALLGPPLPGLELRIADPGRGQTLPERTVGEIEIRGASVTPGYYGNPEATAHAFRGPWLRTGDLGYLADGQLAVCGRIKDVIIVAGRNVFPEDAERAAAGVEGVRAGNVIAFGTPGRRREALVVVAESRSEASEWPRVRDGIAGRVREVVGLAPAEIVLVLPGTLPKTSSGKLQRSLCRERYTSGALHLLETPG